MGSGGGVLIPLVARERMSGVVGWCVPLITFIPYVVEMCFFGGISACRIMASVVLPELPVVVRARRQRVSEEVARWGTETSLTGRRAFNGGRTPSCEAASKPLSVRHSGTETAEVTMT